MANTYFQFKYFRIEQGNCAMKVCTDACLFGALAPVNNATRILDIGAGTGLLALMAAQRSAATIDAVEIDPCAAAQAAENAQKSPWHERVRIYPTPLQEFGPAQPYDVIISNPPFFLNSLRSGKASERTAKHTDSLSFEEIIAFAGSHLSGNGVLCVLLPEYEQSVFAQLANQGNLHPKLRWSIRNSASGKVMRVVTVYSCGKEPVQESEVVIKEANGEYTAQFRHLLKDFYLAF